MEKNQAGKEYPQTWNNLVLQCNFDFLNHLGKGRLVRVIRRFEKSRDKITVLYLTANGSQVWFMLSWNFGKPNGQEIGVLLFK